MTIIRARFSQERLRLIEEEQAREAALRAAREQHEAKLRALERAREEAEMKRRDEERQRQAIQEKLQQMSPCPAGFNWSQVGGGWRCSAGGHFVSDAELQKNFMY